MIGANFAHTWTPAAIKALRSQLGLTQERLARLLNVTVSTVNRWEKEHASPSTLAAEKLDALKPRGAE